MTDNNKQQVLLEKKIRLHLFTARDAFTESYAAIDSVADNSGDWCVTI